MNVDDNPRPLKRARASSHSGSSSPPPQKCESAPVLLLSLPAIILHPPTHPLHVVSLSLSLRAISRCLAFGNLEPDTECKAWTAFAELALKVISGGFHRDPDEHPWARDIEVEAENAISKGLVIAKKHPSLRIYRFHLTLLSAKLSACKPASNPKYTRAVLRRLTASLLPTDPPHIMYTAILATISHLSPYATPTPSPQSLHDTHAALAAVNDLKDRATHLAHAPVVLLAHVLRLRIVVIAGLRNSVAAALADAENALGLVYSTSSESVAKDSSPTEEPSSTAPQSSLTSVGCPNNQPAIFSGAFDAFMAIHTLIFGVVFHTQIGDAAEASVRLTQLHALLDANVLQKAPHGIVTIDLPGSQPLAVQTTHPRVLYLLTFLISASAKLDPVGRKPRRRVFATEGLAVWEREVKRELPLPVWAGVGDSLEVESHLVRIKADLMCELIGVSIMRSEFDSAEQTLDMLIAHTRTYGVFTDFAARITLHHAHLAHALGRHNRAFDCYRVAAHIASNAKTQGTYEVEFVRVAARAGELALLIGCRGVVGEVEHSPDEILRMGHEVVGECVRIGGALESVGQVLGACLSTEITKSKQQLRNALNLTRQSLDNHLRALTLALTSAYYVHTAKGHAREILDVCDQLAAGLGAGKKPERSEKGKRRKMNASEDTEADVMGNAPLRLWIGQQLHEMEMRAGDKEASRRRSKANDQLVSAVEKVVKRGSQDRQSNRPKRRET